MPYFSPVPNRLRLTSIVVSLCLAGCSAPNMDKEKRLDYRSAATQMTNPLETPPDLTPPHSVDEDRFAMPPDNTAAGAPPISHPMGNAQPPKFQNATVLPTSKTVTLVREGNQRWLMTAASPEALWDPLKEFWVSMGFSIEKDEPKIGILQTGWAENRAKIPQDLIRSTLGRVFDNMYSTDERDRFRTRIERRSDGKTEIYITHRGMREVYRNENASKTDSGSTVWQPRPADPELEAEMLTRLMQYLGADKAKAKAQLALSATAKPRLAEIESADGINAPTLRVQQPFDRTWRRVGLALDRAGFTVVDHHRADGIYYVRYVEEKNPDTESTFSKLRFWNASKAPANPENANIQYQITVTPIEQQTRVTVLDKDGKPDPSAAAKKITALLLEQLK